MDVVTGRTHVVVLGGGLVGSFIAKQGARDPDWHITLVDRNRDLLDSLQRKVLLSTNQADLTDRDVVRKCIEEADLVINALPGHIGYQALAWVVEAGKSVVDISFYPEDPRQLQDLAEARNITAVVDCGVMPGLGGMLAAHFISKLDTAEALKIMVGGIPADRDQAGPFEYRAPFSPADVLEEYTRPARMRVDGKVVIVPPMSDLEKFAIEGIGELEAFNTDGLRTILTTLDVPNMVEKTIRYSWHTTRVEFLRALGFFDTEPYRVKDMLIRPLDLTAAVLARSWAVTEGYRELTYMTVEVEGLKDGRRLRHRCELLDRTQDDGTLSMARTTGYPALLTAKALLQDKIPGPGVVAAETLGFNEALFREFLSSFWRLELDLKMSQQDMGPAEEAVTEPLVARPTRLWLPPEPAEPEPEPQPVRSAVAAAVTAVADEGDIETRLAAAMESAVASEPAEPAATAEVPSRPGDTDIEVSARPTEEELTEPQPGDPQPTETTAQLEPTDAAVEPTEAAMGGGEMTAPREEGETHGEADFSMATEPAVPQADAEPAPPEDAAPAESTPPAADVEQLPPSESQELQPSPAAEPSTATEVDPGPQADATADDTATVSPSADDGSADARDSAPSEEMITVDEQPGDEKSPAGEDLDVMGVAPAENAQESAPAEESVAEPIELEEEEPVEEKPLTEEEIKARVAAALDSAMPVLTAAEIEARLAAALAEARAIADAEEAARAQAEAATADEEATSADAQVGPSEDEAAAVASKDDMVASEDPALADEEAATSSAPTVVVVETPRLSFAENGILQEESPPLPSTNGHPADKEQ